MKKKDAMKWIEALCSGEYKQGKGILYNGNDNSYCCLGVLDKINPSLDLSSGKIGSLGNYTRIGLSTPSGLIYQHFSFIELNDVLDFSFEDIANIIQIEYVEGI